jgi:beta-lactamase regulating signal transducer with metallopeptidase domain
MDFLSGLEASGVVARLGWTLLHIVWLAGAAGLALAVVLRLMESRSAQARYAAACGALALVLAASVGTFLVVPAPPQAAPVPMSVAVAAPVPPVVTPLPHAAVGPILPAAATSTPVPPPAAVESAPVEVPSTPLGTRAARAIEPALPWIVLAWCGGVLALSMWQLTGWMLVQRLRRMATGVREPSLAAAAQRLGRAMRVSRPVRLLESALVRVPTVVGWLKPAILLPVGFATGLAPEQVEAVLAHELAHIRRHDYLVNLLQAAVETLFFYHPAVWYISRRIRAERENCCDDMALAAGAERFSYAESLVKLARRSGRPTGASRAAASALLGATGRPSQLRSRIGRLVGLPDGEAQGRTAWLAALIVLASGAVAAAIVAGCLSGNTTARGGEFASAQVSVYDKVIGQRALPATITVTDVAEVAKLAAFFPDVGHGRKAPQAGGWLAGATIDFTRADGTVVHVTVSQNDDLTVWSEGQGDWPVEGDLRAYLIEFRKHHAAEAAAGGTELALGEVVENYAKSIQPTLPKGWSLKQIATKSETKLEISRGEPVSYLNIMPSGPFHPRGLPPYADGQTPYVITLTIAAPISAADLKALRAENAAIGEKMAALHAKMMAFWGKGWQPRNDADRAMLAEYEKLAKSLHKLPDYVTPAASISVEATLDNDWSIFYAEDEASKKVAMECVQVRDGIEAMLGSAATVAGAWGEPEMGVRAALRPEKTRWKAGETPRFLADVSNSGELSFAVARNPSQLEVVVDGQWYSWSGPVGARSSRLAPNGEFRDTAFALGDTWLNQDVGHEKLSLTPGRHVVQVSVNCHSEDPGEPDAWPRSRPVAFEIPASAEAMAGKPAPAEAAGAGPREIEVKTNSCLVIVREKGKNDAGKDVDLIGVTWGAKDPMTLHVKPVEGYVIGRSYTCHLFLDGKPVAWESGGLGGSAWEDEGQGVSWLPPELAARVLAGAKMKVTADVEVFQTSEPTGHMWQPTTGDYRVIWKGQVEGTYPAEAKAAAGAAADTEQADSKRLCDIWRKTVPDEGEAKGVVTAEERALLLKELDGHRGGIAPHDFRRVAAITLGNLHAREAVPLLIARLGDGKENGMMRAEAALALGKIGDKAALVPLLDALADGRDVVDRGHIWVYSARSVHVLAPTPEDLKPLATPERFRGLLAAGEAAPLPEPGPEPMDPSGKSMQNWFIAQEMDALCRGLALVQPADLAAADRTRAANFAKKLLQSGLSVYAFDPANMPNLARFCQAYQPDLYGERIKALDALKAKTAGARPASPPLPTWAELEDLIGWHVESEAVKAFVARYGLVNQRSKAEGDFNRHDQWPFSLHYDGDRISRVTVIVSYEGAAAEKQPVYTAALPRGLQPQDTPEDAVKRLGAPAPPPSDSMKWVSEAGEFHASFSPATHKLLEVSWQARKTPVNWEYVQDMKKPASVSLPSSTVPMGHLADAWMEESRMMFMYPSDYDNYVRQEEAAKYQFALPTEPKSTGPVYLPPLPASTKTAARRQLPAIYLGDSDIIQRYDLEYHFTLPEAKAAAASLRPLLPEGAGWPASANSEVKITNLGVDFTDPYLAVRTDPTSIGMISLPDSPVSVANLKPAEKRLPGWEISLEEALSTPGRVVAVCRIESRFSTGLILGGPPIWLEEQQVTLVSVLDGPAAKGGVHIVSETYEIYFSPQPPSLPLLNNQPGKGESVIWIATPGRSGPTYGDGLPTWAGVKELADTPENRKAVAEAVKAMAANADKRPAPLAPAKRALPGSRMPLEEAMKTPGRVVLACRMKDVTALEAEAKPVYGQMMQGLAGTVQQVIDGPWKGKDLQVTCNILRPLERPTLKDEAVIWIVVPYPSDAKEARSWLALKALADTPENRKVLLTEFIKAVDEAVGYKPKIDAKSAAAETSPRRPSTVPGIHELTWEGYNGTGDPATAVYVLDGERLGKGGAGLAALKARLAKMPRGDEVRIIPYYGDPGGSVRYEYPFDTGDLGRFAKEHGVELRVPGAG